MNERFKLLINIFSIVYFFLFLLCFLNFGFIIKFNKHDIKKLIIAPTIASNAEVKMSCTSSAANVDRKVPLAVPIAMGNSL